MRILLLFSFVAWAACPLDAQASDITAPELARHLGVSTWRVPEFKLPARFTVRLQKIRDGKIDKEGDYPLRDGGKLATGKYQDATSGLVLFIEPEANFP
jgi:hypothetical protein